MASAPRLDALPIRARFARPGRLPPPNTLSGRVAVLDLAFDSAAPERDLAWVERLGERLVVWIDHHEQPVWERLSGQERFVLVPRAQAPACPPLVTAERVVRFAPIDTLLAHGDLDGVLSAAKWMLLEGGLPVPEWLDPDSIAADSRRGDLSPRGERLDRALRAASDHDRVRRAVCASVLAEACGAEEEPAVRSLLDRMLREHERIRASTTRAQDLAEGLDDLAEDAVLVDLRRLPATARIDLTELMLALQREHDWVVVLARAPAGRLKIVASTDPERSGLDLRQEFQLSGFAPFRVHVPAAALLRRLPAARLRQLLDRPGAG